MDNLQKFLFLGEEIGKLNSLYEKINSASILIENLVNNLSYIAVINELRYALDHIFKATRQDNEDEIKIEINKVRGHLSRAGYDVFELYATDTIFKIQTIWEKYDRDIRCFIIPDYAQSIKFLRIVQADMAEIRANKKSYNDSFDEYAKKIAHLTKIYNEFTDKETELYKEQKKKDSYTLYAPKTIDEIDKMLGKYDMEIRLSIIPDYAQNIEILREIQKNINYADYDRLTELYNKFTGKESELNKEQTRKIKKNKKQKLITIISLIIGILGFATALISLFLR